MRRTVTVGLRRAEIVVCWVPRRVLLGLVRLCWVVNAGHFGDGRPVAALAGDGSRGGLPYRGRLAHEGPGWVGVQRERRGLAAVDDEPAGRPKSVHMAEVVLIELGQ